MVTALHNGWALLCATMHHLLIQPYETVQLISFFTRKPLKLRAHRMMVFIGHLRRAGFCLSSLPFSPKKPVAKKQTQHQHMKRWEFGAVELGSSLGHWVVWYAC